MRSVAVLAILFGLGLALIAHDPQVESGTKATGIKCSTKESGIKEHDKNVALLQICGGIVGKIQKCEGAPTSTTGTSGTAKFALDPTVPGSTINISKGRWEQCVKSAEAACPGGVGYSATCPRGASAGDIKFVKSRV